MTTVTTRAAASKNGFDMIATSAAVHQKQPRHLGFTFACQTILASWMLLSTQACRDARALYDTILAYIAANEVAPKATPRGTAKNINPCHRMGCRRQCHSSLLLDWSARRVGLKELWTLKWYRNCDVAGCWTKAGGVQPEDWPEWMRGFKDY